MSRCPGHTDFRTVKDETGSVGGPGALVVPVKAVVVGKAAAAAGCEIINCNDHTDTPTGIGPPLVHQVGHTRIFRRDIDVEGREILGHATPDSLNSKQLIIRECGPVAVRIVSGGNDRGNPVAAIPRRSLRDVSIKVQVYGFAGRGTAVEEKGVFQRCGCRFRERLSRGGRSCPLRIEGRVKASVDFQQFPGLSGTGPRSIDESAVRELAGVILQMVCRSGRSTSGVICTFRRRNRSDGRQGGLCYKRMFRRFFLSRADGRKEDHT